MEYSWIKYQLKLFTPLAVSYIVFSTFVCRLHGCPVSLKMHTHFNTKWPCKRSNVASSTDLCWFICRLHFEKKINAFLLAAFYCRRTCYYRSHSHTHNFESEKKNLPVDSRWIDSVNNRMIFASIKGRIFKGQKSLSRIKRLHVWYLNDGLIHSV